MFPLSRAGSRRQLQRIFKPADSIDFRTGADMDRDSKYSEAFRHLLEQAGVHCVRLPARSPNLTPHIERFMRTIKDECLHRMIFFGEKSLQKAAREFLAHSHGERNHQGRENRIIEPGAEVGQLQGNIRCRERLGGMLRHYYRDAA